MLYGAVGKVGLRAFAAPFSPAQLFAAGEIGAWYDPSDLTTMFQDSAGTTPVTAVGQPVGLILDKSKSMAIGSELVTSGYDVLFTSLAAGITATANSIVMTATIGNATWPNAVVDGNGYRVSFTVSGLSGGAVILRFGSATNDAAISVNGTYTYNIVSDGTSFTLRANGPTTSATITNISIKQIAGNHASQSTSTARPTYQSSGGISYLAFDGTDDFLVTGTINPGSVDKAQVFAGVRKLSDAATGVVVETTTDVASVAGGFAMAASNVANGANNLSWGGGANRLIEAYRTYTSPDTRVFSLALDSDTVPRITARLNGVAVSANSSSGVGGTGNFVSSPLYIGRRGGTTLPLNGNIYSLIVRFGSNLDATTISNTETWVNGKTLAY